MLGKWHYLHINGTVSVVFFSCLKSSKMEETEEIQKGQCKCLNISGKISTDRNEHYKLVLAEKEITNPDDFIM